MMVRVKCEMILLSKLVSFAYTRPKWTNLSFFAYRSLNNITVLTVLDIKKLLSQIYLERDW